MKTRLPKMLLAALMAAMVSYSHAELTVPGKIIVVEGDTPSTYTDISVLQYPGAKPKNPVVKDGSGTLVIEGASNNSANPLNSPLVVREGTVKLVDCDLYASGAYPGGSSATAYLGVGGKNAELILSNTKFSTGGESYLNVGTPDGSGTLTLTNNSDVHINVSLFAGCHDYVHTKDNPGIVGWYHTSNGTTISTTSPQEEAYRYDKGQYVPAVNNFPNRTFAKANINVLSGSKLRFNTQFSLGMGEVLVSGKGSIIETGNPNLYSAIMGYWSGSESIIRVMDEGEFHAYAYLLVGSKSAKETINKIYVDGDGSKFIVDKQSWFGVEDNTNSVTHVELTNGGKMELQDFYIGINGSDTSVSFAIDSASSLTGNNAFIEGNSQIDNNGKISVAELVINGGEITNSATGTINADAIQMTAGVLNNAGVLNVKSQLEVAKAATLNCLAGSTISGVMPTGCTYSFTLSSKNLSEAGTTLAAGTQYSTATPLTLTLTAAENLKAGKYMLLDATAGVQTNRSATPAAVESVSGLGATKEDIVWEDGILYFNLGENLIVARDPLADAVQASNWGVFKSSQAFVGTLFAPRTNAVVVESDGKGGIVPAEAMTLAWGTAYSSFSRQGGSGEFGGAEYSIYGAAVGVERQFASGRSVGVALGYDWGRVSPYNTARVDQDSWHVALYGRAAQWKVGQKGELAIDWSAAAGNTSSECDALGADWSQDSMQLDVRATYTRELTERTACSVFAGVQYYAQNDDSTSRVEADSLQNLRLMAGAGISHKLTSRATVYGEVSVYNDAMRHNPGVVLDGFTYGTGANPGRIGGDVTVGAQYGLSEQWTLRGSYSFEAAENNRVHNVNVGAVYSF